MAILQKTIPLWDRWSREALINKRDLIGAREFDRGWRQIALSDDEVIFREEHLAKCISKNDILYYPMSGTPRDAFCPSGHITYMGVDLAIAAKTSAGDYFVITGISVNPKTGHRTLVSLYRQRGLTFDQQLKKVEMYANFLDPMYIFVENNAYQAAFVQELERTTSLPVQAFTTTALKKADLDYGLPRLALEVEQGKWTFPIGDRPSEDAVNILLQELKSFPIGRHDDCIFSLWFARCAAAHQEKRIEKMLFVI